MYYKHIYEVAALEFRTWKLRTTLLFARKPSHVCVYCVLGCQTDRRYFHRWIALSPTSHKSSCGTSEPTGSGSVFGGRSCVVSCMPCTKRQAPTTYSWHEESTFMVSSRVRSKGYCQYGISSAPVDSMCRRVQFTHKHTLMFRSKYKSRSRT